MDGNHFDNLTRSLAAGVSRRTVLRRLAGGLAGGLGLARLGAADADTLCKPATPLAQAKCTKDAQCCAGLVCDGAKSKSGPICQAGCHVGGTFYAGGATNPANPCQSCQPSASTTSWTNKANGTSCDDGNACTRTDTCQSGTCTGSNPVVCTALDQCHVAGVCDHATGVCTNPAKPDGTSCSDQNACTQTDTCQGGVCSGANPVVCAPPDPCHRTGVCNTATGQCAYAPVTDGTPCDDGDACTLGDTCQAGAYAPGPAKRCVASDQCHVAGTCNPATGQCSTPIAPNGTSCDDGNACTRTDTCQSGTCTGSNPVVCTALSQCHDAGSCNPGTGQCSNPPKASGAACNDGNACTQTDRCDGAGHCVGSNPVVCAASDQCHDAGTCDPATGVCSNPAKPDGTSCSGGGACTTGGTCQAGVCVCSCTPATSCPAGQDCGTAPDGCGGTLNCGTCTSPQTCGGGGTPNVCGCTPTTCSALGATCGSPADGCGGTLSCGACTSPETCGGGGTPNVCGGCTPTTCAQGACGTIPDGCGGTLDCGTCPYGVAGPLLCGGGGTPNVCGCLSSYSECTQDYQCCTGVCQVPQSSVPTDGVKRCVDPIYPEP